MTSRWPEAHVLNEFEYELEREFGQGGLTISKDNFTNCGIRHTLKPHGYELDQTEYIKALKTIDSTDVTRKKGDAAVSPFTGKLFLAVLMVLACALMTRPDLCVYVNALQRNCQAPLEEHIRKLNAIVRWSQAPIGDHVQMDDRWIPTLGS